MYRNLAEMYGKRAARQDYPATNHRIPVALEACCAVLSKQRLSILKIGDVCLIEHVLAMLKELRERGKSPILS